MIINRLKLETEDKFERVLLDIAEDLRNSDLPGLFGDSDTAAKRRDFVVWYFAFRINRGFLREQGLPTNPSSYADLGGETTLSRQTIHKVLSARGDKKPRWFVTGVDLVKRFVEPGIGQAMIEALDQLPKNIRDNNGSVSNQAIKITFDMWLNMQSDPDEEAALLNDPLEGIEAEVERIEEAA